MSSRLRIPKGATLVRCLAFTIRPENGHEPRSGTLIHSAIEEKRDT